MGIEDEVVLTKIISWVRKIIIKYFPKAKKISTDFWANYLSRINTQNAKKIVQENIDKFIKTNRPKLIFIILIFGFVAIFYFGLKSFFWFILLALSIGAIAYFISISKRVIRRQHYSLQEIAVFFAGIGLFIFSAATYLSVV